MIVRGIINFLEMSELPQLVKDAVLASSEPVAVDSLEIRGYDLRYHPG